MPSRTQESKEKIYRKTAIIGRKRPMIFSSGRNKDAVVLSLAVGPDGELRPQVVTAHKDDTVIIHGPAEVYEEIR